MAKHSLENSQCCLVYDDEKKEIFGQDRTDPYNDPAFYTKSKRGLAKAWNAMQTLWTVETSMHDALVICQAHKIRTHYWCMVD
jgi:hypothetical protein